MTIEVTLPAGRYVVGDPCYCFSHDTDSWDKLCKQMDLRDASTTEFTRESGVYELELNGHRLVFINTAFGDGTYYDERGNEYGVDAGLLGLVPIALVEDGSTYDEYKKRNDTGAGREVEFDEPPTCYYNCGVVVLGRVRIDTDPELEEDEDY